MRLHDPHHVLHQYRIYSVLDSIQTDSFAWYNLTMTQQDIINRLTDVFSPTHITVHDDSARHAHHQGTPHTQHTHFNVTIVSEQFDGQSRIQRHRAIHAALSDAFKGTLHALAIVAKTPTEWQALTG